MRGRGLGQGHRLNFHVNVILSVCLLYDKGSYWFHSVMMIVVGLKFGLALALLRFMTFEITHIFLKR